jgi:hypothetical protein
MEKWWESLLLLLVSNDSNGWRRNNDLLLCSWTDYEIKGQDKKEINNSEVEWVSLTKLSRMRAVLRFSLSHRLMKMSKGYSPRVVPFASLFPRLFSMFFVCFVIESFFLSISTEDRDRRGGLEWTRDPSSLLVLGFLHGDWEGGSGSIQVLFAFPCSP